MTLATPEVICTHESDLDGLVSGLLLQRLAKHMFGTEITLEAFHYQGWKLRQMSERVAWVADFTFESRFDRPNWLVLDHHAGDFRPKQARLIHDLGKSAALLCYELCVQHGLGSPELERIVHLTHVSDLFLEEDPDFALACDYASLVKNYGFWNLHTVIAGRPEALLDHPLLEVMQVRRRVEDPIGYKLALADVTEISPTVGLVRPPVGNTNLIVHELLNRGATPYPVLVSLHRRGAGVFVVSFRSLNGEALATAQRFEGGGGHPNASGATLPRLSDHDAAVQFLRTRLAPPAPASRPGATTMAEAFTGLQWPDMNR
jgi:hypothetical protein